MFVGHLAAGLIFKKAEPRINLGVFFMATLLADVLLWILVLAGLEQVIAPDPFSEYRYFTFVFPCSHGLAASLGWSALVAGGVWSALGSGFPLRARAGLWVGAAVFSHFILDFLVHVPDLPVWGANSFKLGLGLWRHLPLALAFELALTGAALCFALKGSGLSRARSLSLIGWLGLTALLTAAGPYLSSQPPPPSTQALSSLVVLMLSVVAGFWIDGRFGLLSRPSTRA